MHRRLPIAALLLSLFACSQGTGVFAAATPTLSQTINAGTLVTDIRDASRVSVASPSFTMSTTTVGFTCLSSGTASTGTLGSNTQRIYVDNPDAAGNGWTLTIAATSGATSLWKNTGNTLQFDYNDPTGSPAGCTDGVDTDSVAGQLTIDPSVGTLTADCTSCTTSNVTKGSSAAFSEGVVNSITLLNASTSASKVWRGYLTGVNLSQTIPAEQRADTYTINATITVTAS